MLNELDKIGAIIPSKKDGGRFSKGGLVGKGTIIEFDPENGLSYCETTMVDECKRDADGMSCKVVKKKTGKGIEFTSDRAYKSFNVGGDEYVIEYDGDYQAGEFVNGLMTGDKIRKIATVTINFVTGKLISVHF